MGRKRQKTHLSATKSATSDLNKELSGFLVEAFKDRLGKDGQTAKALTDVAIGKGLIIWFCSPQAAKEHFSPAIHRGYRMIRPMGALSNCYQKRGAKPSIRFAATGSEFQKLIPTRSC